MPGVRLPIVEPKNTNSRRPPPGISARCSSKSPQTALISTLRVLAAGWRSRCRQHAGVDVERHEAAQRSAVAQRVQQHAGSSPRCRCPARRGCRRRLADGDVGRRGPQDLRLGAGRVVLGQPGDLVEQITAHGIVEPLGRQRLRCLLQAVEHVAAQRRRYAESAARWLDSVQRHQRSFRARVQRRQRDAVCGDFDEVAVRDVLPVRSRRRRARWPAPRRRRGAGSTRCRPRWWPAVENRWRPRYSSRASGSAAPTSRRCRPARPGPRSKMVAASIALSTGGFGSRVSRQHGAVDDTVVRQQPPAVGERRGRAGSRSACRRSPSAPRPPRSGCAAPALPRRTTRRPTAATALRHRRGTCPPCRKSPTPQPSALIRPCFCRRGA